MSRRAQTAAEKLREKKLREDAMALVLAALALLLAARLGAWVSARLALYRYGDW